MILSEYFENRQKFTNILIRNLANEISLIISGDYE